MRTDPVVALAQLGGVASAQSLLALTTRRQLRTAVTAGRVRRAARGRHTLPDLDPAREQAAALHGALALRSAALAHGWPVVEAPEVPEIVVSAARKIGASRREGARLLWADLDADEQRTGITDPVRTVVDCARHLPFGEGLAVADSALRAGAVTESTLAEAAERVRGAGAARVRRVLAEADARAANPFESALRALCLDAGLTVEPQGEVILLGGALRPDLVDRGRRLAIEGDSWTWHATRDAHKRDCMRYNSLVCEGWSVLRFTWEHVMLAPSYVAELLEEAARAHGPDEVALLARPQARSNGRGVLRPVRGDWRR